MIVPTKDSSFSDFMASLIVDFPEENIPFFRNEKDWELSGSFLSQGNSFAKNGVPIPNGFKNRTDWELAFFQSMAPYS
jgi:hypothetical protein